MPFWNGLNNDQDKVTIKMIDGREYGHSRIHCIGSWMTALMILGVRVMGILKHFPPAKQINPRVTIGPNDLVNSQQEMQKYQFILNCVEEDRRKMSSFMSSYLRLIMYGNRRRSIDDPWEPSMSGECDGCTQPSEG